MRRLLDNGIPLNINWKTAMQEAIQYKSTSFVSNRIQVDSSALPFPFSDGSVLDKATPNERENIKSKVELLIGTTGTVSLASIFEQKSIATELPGGGYSYQYEPLQEADWKYYVVRYPGTRSVNVDLHYAASICDVPIDLLSFYFTEISQGYRSEPLHKYFKIGTTPELIDVNVDSLKEIACTYDLLMSATGGTGGKGEFPYIHRALLMLDSLNELPLGSGFLCLGLFAIIEMLITHNPGSQDRGDSITHQMKSKMPLLSRRFDRPLPLAKYFGGAKSETVWSSLYSYRSNLAHGGVPDFGKNLSVLISQYHADTFLLITVKSLIRHALKEPYLYLDLREC